MLGSRSAVPLESRSCHACSKNHSRVGESLGNRMRAAPFTGGRPLIGGGNSSAVNQFEDDGSMLPGDRSFLCALALAESSHAVDGVCNPPLATICGFGPLNVLQNRFTARPFVAVLVGAEAVAHGHADHVIAVA